MFKEGDRILFTTSMLAFIISFISQGKYVIAPKVRWIGWPSRSIKSILEMIYKTTKTEIIPNEITKTFYCPDKKSQMQNKTKPNDKE